ncbi:atherin-like [Pongo pygmaeus]|uniref:atherin-like n=1 Tax=Pongo pygmaeus TaxID=9600 RepID=UPI00300CA159
MTALVATAAPLRGGGRREGKAGPERKEEEEGTRLASLRVSPGTAAQVPKLLREPSAAAGRPSRARGSWVAPPCPTRPTPHAPGLTPGVAPRTRGPRAGATAAPPAGRRRAGPGLRLARSSVAPVPAPRLLLRPSQAAFVLRRKDWASVGEGTGWPAPT